MNYIRANEKDTEQVVMLVQDTIRAIYPKYYPKEVVDFFCELHCKENISKDIENGFVGILQDDNHITRVYVKQTYQGQGYGSYIMQCLENELGLKYDTVYLDASLPSSYLYEKRGYKTITHKRCNMENGVILVYEIMKKSLPNVSTSICYEGKHFVLRVNTENGEIDENTLFSYHQKNNIIWADYSGGEIIKGHLIGTVTEEGELDFYYQHINERDQVRIGVCHSVPRILESGKIELFEKWEWLNGDKSKGTSVIYEK